MLIDKIKIWLCERYCPRFYFDVPYYDNQKLYNIQVAVVYGYWGNKVDIVSNRTIRGIKSAYYNVRWDALKTDFLYPKWLFNIGIHYHIEEIK